MDKITSHVIQINIDPQSLNSRVSDTRALDLEASDSKVSEASNMSLRGLEFKSLVSDPSVSDSRPGLGGQGLRRSRVLTFLGFDLSRGTIVPMQG
jgi:hypothetical protein